MADSDAMPDTEMQLEVLLRGVLGEDASGLEPAPEHTAVSPELVELRDLASRLHEAGRQLPTPGPALLAQAVRRSIRRHRNAEPSRPLTVHGPYRAWVGIAAAMLLAVSGVGAIASWAGASPASPWYGVRLAVENLQVAVTPDPHARAWLLVRDAHARIAEIQAMAATGDTAGLRRAADALDADAGWLHALLTILPAQEQRQLVRGLGHV